MRLYKFHFDLDHHYNDKNFEHGNIILSTFTVESSIETSHNIRHSIHERSVSTLYHDESLLKCWYRYC